MNAWILTALCIAILATTCICMPQPMWDLAPADGGDEMVTDDLEMHSGNYRQKRQLYGLGYYAYPAVIRRVYHTYPLYAIPFKKT